MFVGSSSRTGRKATCSFQVSMILRSPPVALQPSLAHYYSQEKDQIMSMSKCEAAPACHCVYSGEGTCAKNKTYAHTCQCNPGYSNLLNIPVFLCYSDCATGSDSCRRLGIGVANSTANGSNSSSNDSNKGIGSSSERSSY